MKSAVILSLVSLFFTLHSCETSPVETAIQKFTVEYFSEIEQKDLNIQKSELSDRDAFKELMEYHESRREKEQAELDEAGGIYSSSYDIYGASIDNHLKQERNTLTAWISVRGKGNLLESYLHGNPDTVSLKYLYLDDRGNIISQRHVK